jgi:hypothetical protein
VARTAVQFHQMQASRTASCDLVLQAPSVANQFQPSRYKALPSDEVDSFRFVEEVLPCAGVSKRVKRSGSTSSSECGKA